MIDPPITETVTTTPDTAPGTSLAPTTAAAVITTAPTTYAPSTTAVPTTLPPTTEAPTTTLDPVDEVMSEFAPLFATANPAGRDLFAKGSPAFLYYDALVLLRQLTSFPDSGASTINGGIRTSDGIVLDEVALNERGQIVNMNRKGPPNPPPQPDRRLRSARGVALRLARWPPPLDHRGVPADERHRLPGRWTSTTPSCALITDTASHA